MKKVISITVFIISVSFSLFGQHKYWISFKDKNTSEYDYAQYLSEQAIQNRKNIGLSLSQYSDVPVNETYVNKLNTMDVDVLVKSRWLNAVSAILKEEQISSVRNLSFVSSVDIIDNRIKLASTEVAVKSTDFHYALKQMQVGEFLKDSLTGRDVLIGVIDAGFYNAKEEKLLSHIFNEDRIVDQRDFLAPERKNIVTEKATDSDYHGRMVLENIAGYEPRLKYQKGLAPNAKFYLARTEHGDKEFRGEEDTWIAAMEWMDSKGVRLINTSLGYAIKMDDPNDNYKQTEMDGKTTRISKAAQIATTEKGIFLAVSAGNEGSNPTWEIISAPADAQGVLAVGATKDNSCERIEYSSIGPEFLPYLKPNVSCYSPNGTSFSSPAVTGFVACLMQKAPNLSNIKLKEIMEKSANLYPYGNNYIGYGVPLASRALKLLENPEYNFNNATEKNVSSSKYIVKSEDPKVVEAILFHKKNDKIVITQQSVPVKKGKMKIRKSPGAARTTVAYGEKVLEIIWE